MAKNLGIDKTLQATAQQISGIQTTSGTADTALDESTEHRTQRDITRLFGTIDFDPDYDYKQMRVR